MGRGEGTRALILAPKAKGPANPLPCSVPCTCKVKFLSATPAALEATQVKTPESASCTWEILKPTSKGGDEREREREGERGRERERERDRQTERERDRQTERETDRKRE